MKNKGGRPTDYNDNILRKANKYLSTCIDKEDKNGGVIKANLPSAVGLAIYLGVDKSTIYLWGKEHEEFSYILNNVQTAQEQRLLNKGLDSGYNSTIAKLVLSKHGYRDSQELTGKDGKDLLPTPILGGQSNAISKNDSIK